MKKYSIVFTINLVFLISFVLISTSFAMFYNFNQQRDRHIEHRRDLEISKIFMHHYRTNGLDSELMEYIESLDYVLITDKDKIDAIFSQKDIQVKEVGLKRFFNIKHVSLKERSYVYIKTPDQEVMLSAKNALSSSENMFLGIYAAVLLVFILLYLSVVNKLKPITTLRQSVKNFGNENFDLGSFDSNGDEISQLGAEFYAAAKKLKKIKESRNVFIRNIMHELKTPIAKGKFLIQLPPSDENTQSMQKIFYRLEYLISEFASIEELISSKKELEVREYFLEDIIDNAVDILMCDEDEVIKEFENRKIRVDFNLFCVAVKNLLDNGIKFSKDKIVHVKMQDNKIIFENSADALTYPLESYFEPFFKDGTIKTDQSFGLGLYIVKHILDAHHFRLEYEHLNGINRFAIRFIQ